MNYDIKILVEENIESFNNHQKDCIAKLKYDYPDDKDKIEYDFNRRIETNFKEFVNDPIKIQVALDDFEKKDFKKISIKTIANKFFIKTSSLQNSIDNLIFNEFYENYNKELNIEHKELNINGLSDLILENRFSNQKKKDYFKKIFIKNLKIFLPYIVKGGFNNNFVNLEMGLNSSNQGDGAEYIFVAKAMIAGFNSSVVDVGSSGYDAVIENEQTDLLKVQVKSFSGDKFSRKGRDRGGEGQDPSNRRNRGKLVTSKNCDVFVAVNKNNGELFIFKGKEIDLLPEKDAKRDDYMSNWENWSKINL